MIRRQPITKSTDTSFPYQTIVRAEADGSAVHEKALKKQGMTIMTGAGDEKHDVSDKGVKAAIKGKDGKVVNGDFSHVIVAIGIVPNTENIGLEALKVDTERGHIKTDGLCRSEEHTS